MTNDWMPVTIHYYKFSDEFLKGVIN